jgi:hypothetical protein
MLRPKSPQSSFYGSYLYDRIVPQDHLTGTSLMTSANGALLGTIKYTPFENRRKSLLIIVPMMGAGPIDYVNDVRTGITIGGRAFAVDKEVRNVGKECREG